MKSNIVNDNLSILLHAQDIPKREKYRLSRYSPLDYNPEKAGF